MKVDLLVFCTAYYVMHVFYCAQVVRRLLNMGCSGAELWSLYQAAETCRQCLSPEVRFSLSLSCLVLEVFTFLIHVTDLIRLLEGSSMV